VFFWFIGTAVVAVGFVFRDPTFDYRLLIVGSVLPIADGFFGGARALHSLTVSVLLLAVLMLATTGRRSLRKLLLGLPIGMILHLVFGGAWTDTDVFWWPFTGVDFGDAPLPLADHLPVSLVLEVVGVAICWWLVRANALQLAANRRQFLHDGRLRRVPAGP
jgi:membrane-bound metal-dependent hydrolase YbcI (DUF457 family)